MSALPPISKSTEKRSAAIEERAVKRRIGKIVARMVARQTQRREANRLALRTNKVEATPKFGMSRWRLSL